MKVIETTLDTRTGLTGETVWSTSADDLTAIQSVVNILRHQKDRDEDLVHTAVGRFKTIEIRIEL